MKGDKMTDIDNTSSSAASQSEDSVQKPQASGEEKSQQQKAHEDKVAYETYKRTLSEAKKFKSEAQQLKEKLGEYENKILADEGKKDEVIERLRKEKEEVYRTLKEREASFAETQIRAQVESKARELGCVDTEALTKLVDFEGLDVVDGHKVSSQSLEMVLNEAKEKRPYLFSKPAPKVHDGVPANEKPNGKVDFNKMTTEQMKEWARKNMM